MNDSTKTTSLGKAETVIEIVTSNPRVLSLRRIKATLTIFMVILLLALSGLMVVLVSRMFAHLTPSIRADLQIKAKRGVRDLANRVELGAALNDGAAVTKAIGDYTDDADVVAVRVMAADGTVLFDRGDLPVGIFGQVEGEVVEEGHRLVAWAPVAIEGALVGRVAFVVSTERVEAGNRLRAHLIGIGAGGCLAALLLGVLFVNLYVGPIVKLTQSTLDQLRDLATTLDDRVRRRTAELTSANDKLGVNMEKLKNTQTALVKASRSAGMADVATAVLHNVGNVLNSANVSTTLVSERIRKSKAMGLGKAVELMRAHTTDLPHFLTQDPKGKKIPEYLCLISDALSEEREGMLAEIDQLARNMEHIRAVINTQQSYAKVSGGHLEVISIPDVLDEALGFDQISNDKHEVKVVRDYDALAPCMIDRHKLFQIVMNLLSNARQAVKEMASNKSIEIRLRADRGAGDLPERFTIQIIDTGAGIEAENMVKMFQHGFTTKKDGHGFGLHSSALAAQELGGSLAAASDGPGRGATFTLELPFRSAEVSGLTRLSA